MAPASKNSQGGVERGDFPQVDSSQTMRPRTKPGPRRAGWATLAQAGRSGRGRGGGKRVPCASVARREARAQTPLGPLCSRGSRPARFGRAGPCSDAGEDVAPRRWTRRASVRGLGETRNPTWWATQAAGACGFSRSVAAMSSQGSHLPLWVNPARDSAGHRRGQLVLCRCQVPWLPHSSQRNNRGRCV